MDTVTKTGLLPKFGPTSHIAASRPPPAPLGIDAHAPAEVPARVEKAGIGIKPEDGSVQSD